MSSKIEPEWIETIATVTSCTYQFARMNTLTMGLQTGEKFRITFEYYAHGRLYFGDFQSPTAVSQSEHIVLHYNPLRPEQNDRSNTSGRAGGRLITAGVFGSILLSLFWLLSYRGCS